jgi:hypothetical protein
MERDDSRHCSACDGHGRDEPVSYDCDHAATIATLRDDLAHCERAWEDAGKEIATLRAALDGLDVERLARAYRNVMFRGVGPPEMQYEMELASQLAREYAALAAAKGNRKENNICPICHKVIINDAHGGLHPSPGDHDPGEHVLATYEK